MADTIVAVFPSLPDPDYEVVTPTKEVAGRVRTLRGDPVPFATVNLYRTRDDTFIRRTTANAEGFYAFVRDETDPETYYVMAYSEGTLQVHGASDRYLPPKPIGT